MGLNLSAFGLKEEKQNTLKDLDLSAFGLRGFSSSGVANPQHATRNNNPGNLKFAGQPGAVKAPDSDFAMFRTPQDGFEALKRDLTAKVTGKSVTGLKPTDTLADLINKYAPPSDNNPTGNYISHVASRLGVSANTKLHQLTNRVGDVAMAMAEFEDRDFFATLTGAKTAHASSVPQPTTRLNLSAFGVQQREVKIPEYRTDVLGTGFVLGTQPQVHDTKSTKVGKKSAEVVFDIIKKPFDYAVEKLSNTQYMKEAAEGLNLIESGQVKGTTMDFMAEELLTNISEVAKSFSGRGVATAFDVTVAKPINSISQLMYGKSNVVGDYLAGFATEMYDTFDTEKAKEVREQEFTAGKALSPDFWMTTVAETIPTSLAFMKVASVPYGGVRALLGNSKFATAVASVTAGTAMRGLESASEASDTYDAAKAKGLSDKEAMLAARDVFVDNMKLAGLDAVQVALAFAPVGKDAKTKGVLYSILKEVAKMGVGAVTEGGEEVYQYKAQQEALGEPFSFSDPKAQEAGFIGAAMGVGFQAGAQVSESNRKAVVRKYLDDVAAYLPEDVQKTYKAAESAGGRMRVLDDYAETNPEEVQKAVAQVEFDNRGAIQRGKEIVAATKDAVNQMSVLIKDPEERKKAIDEFVTNMKTTNKKTESGKIDVGAMAESAGNVRLENDDLETSAKREGQTGAQKETDPWSAEEINKIFDANREEVKEIQTKDRELRPAEELQTQIELLEDTIRDNDAAQLGKYLRRANSTLAQVVENNRKRKQKPLKNGKVRTPIDSRVTELGFKDMDDAQRGWESYQKQVEQLKGLKEELAARTELDAKAQALADKVAKTKAERAQVKRALLEKAYASKEGRAVKRVEQRVAKRQVAVEKRAGQAAVIQERIEQKAKRDEIVNKFRERIAGIKEKATKTQALKKQIRDYAKAYLPKKGVPPSVYEAIETAIVTATTEANVSDILDRIDNYAEEGRKRNLKSRILALYKRIEKHAPGMAIEDRKKVEALMSYYDLRKTKTPYAGKKPFADTSAQELHNLEVVMKAYLAQGREKIKGERAAKESQIEEITQRLITTATPIETNATADQELISNEPPDRSLTARFHDKWNRAKNASANFYQAHLFRDAMLDWLDGQDATYDGEHIRFFGAFTDTYLKMNYQLRDHMQNRLARRIQKMEFKDKKHSLLKIGLVGIRQQEGGYAKLENLGYTKKDADAITLDAQEQSILDEMLQVYEAHFPQVQALMRQLYNKEVKKVNLYFPFLTDYAKASNVPIHERIDPGEELKIGQKENQKKSFLKGKVDDSRTKSRVGAGQQQVQLDAWKVFQQSTADMAYLITMSEHIRDMHTVANNPEYQKAVGTNGAIFILNYVDTLARAGGAPDVQDIRWLDNLRSYVSAGILGYKLSTIAIQTTAIIDGMAYTNPKYVMEGMRLILTDPKARNFVVGDGKEIVGQFPEVYDRVGGEIGVRELNNIDNPLSKLGMYGFMPMQVVDKYIAAGVALGAYMQMAEEKGIEVDFDKAVDEETMIYAQMVMSRSQASTIFTKLPQAITRGRGYGGSRTFSKLMLQFQTFLLSRFTRFAYDAVQVGIFHKQPKVAARQLSVLATAITAGALVRSGLASLLAALFPDGDDDDDKYLAGSKFVHYAVMEGMGTFPYASNIYGAMAYDSAMFPVLDVLQSLSEDARSALTSKNPETRQRAAARLLFTMTTMAGIPGSVQANQVAMGLMPKAQEGGITVKGGGDTGLNVDIPGIDLEGVDIEVPNIDIPDIQI